MPSLAHAATFQVINLNDSGTGSLRAAIASANANVDSDTITFASTLKGTVTLTRGELLISQSVTITGPGSSLLAISGANKSRIFNITGGAVKISGLTLTKGSVVGERGTDGSGFDHSGLRWQYYYAPGAPGGSAYGGAILNLSTLALDGVVLSSNQVIGGDGGTGASVFISGGVIPEARYYAGTGGQGGQATGGAIYNGGTLNITKTSFVSNRTVGGNGGQGGDAHLSLVPVYVGAGGKGGDGLGGAIYNAETGILHITPTYSGNTVVGGNGGAEGAVLPKGKPGPLSAKGSAQGPNLFEAKSSQALAPVAVDTTITGIQGQLLSASLQASGGTGALSYSLVSGTLPAGLILNPSTGLVSGTPIRAAKGQKVTFRVSDSQQQNSTATATFNIQAENIAPAVQVNTPTSKQQIAVGTFGAGSVTGSARDNVGVTQVQVRLSRTRNSVVQYWNGSAFTSTLTFVPATLALPVAKASNWVWDKNLPPASALDIGSYTISAYASDAAGNNSRLGSHTFSLTSNTTPASSASAS